MATFTLKNKLKNGNATYEIPGVKGLLILRTPLAEGQEHPQTLTVDFDGFVEANAEAKERAEKRAARKAERDAKIVERAQKAQERAEKALARAKKLQEQAAKATGQSLEADSTDVEETEEVSE